MTMIIGIALILSYAVYKFVIFTKQHKKTDFKRPEEIRKIIATGKPFIVPSLPATPNRAHRRRMERQTKNKKK